MRKSAAVTPSFDAHVFLDVTEKFLILYFFVCIILRTVPMMHDGWAIVDFMILISEGAAAAFIVTRRTTRTASLKLTDWALTGLGTFLPLTVVASKVEPLLPLSLCVFVIFMGFILQISAKLTLRRSFGLAPANRGVKIGGPYRLLRHPMYAGYLMTHIAFLCAHPTLWNLTVYATALTAQCFRLLAEERVLSEDPTYVDFMKTTRYRLIPFVF